MDSTKEMATKLWVEQVDGLCHEMLRKEACKEICGKNPGFGVTELTKRHVPLAYASIDLMTH